MATYVTPKRATAFQCFVELRSQANTKIFQVNPTLAAGDVKVSKDGGAFANLATLPVVTPAGGRSVQVDLSGTEMTADNVKVVFSDAAGAEWCDLSILIQTTARQVDDLLPTASYTAPLDAAGTRTAVGLSSANLDTQLSAIDDFLDTEVAAILAAVDTEVAAILALLDDPRSEPGQVAPPVNPDMATKVDYLYKSWRNKKTNDGTVTNLYADDATTVDQKQATSESAGTVTKGEWAVGP